MRSSRFEFRVRGRLNEKLLSRFDGLEAEVQAVETILRGPVEDQAALHGLLERIRVLGLELVALRPVDGCGATARKSGQESQRLHRADDNKYERDDQEEPEPAIYGDSPEDREDDQQDHQQPQNSHVSSLPSVSTLP
jgi:hypothetical protein